MVIGAVGTPETVTTEVKRRVGTSKARSNREIILEKEQRRKLVASVLLRLYTGGAQGAISQ